MKIKITVAAILLIVGFFIGFAANSKTTIIYEDDYPDAGIGIINSYSGKPKTASIMVPAVNEDKSGLATTLRVEIVPGDGRIFANIDKMLFYTDTQNSIRTARRIAEEKTGIDLSGYDIFYTVETDATAIEGPSAGVSFAVTTIAALTGKKIKEDVMITGALNHDATIGPVSNVMEKAIAIKDLGIETFLVPLTQGDMSEFETRKYCEEIGESSICTDEEIPNKVDISDIAGINVIEVYDIDEVMDYIFE